MRGPSLSRYHFEAGIAACHAAAPSFSDTDWRAVVDLYDGLLDVTGSPIVALNRAVAIAMLHGPHRALEVLLPLQSLPALKGYYLLPATFGYLYADLGDRDRAVQHYET